MVCSSSGAFHGMSNLSRRTFATVLMQAACSGVSLELPSRITS